LLKQKNIVRQQLSIERKNRRRRTKIEEIKDWQKVEQVSRRTGKNYNRKSRILE
jgi:hypothetical protein